MNYAIILSAGKGKRFGGPKHKFVHKNQPLLYWSLKAFENSKLTDKIIVVARDDITELVKGFRKVTKIVKGGKKRQDSMSKGLLEIKEDGYVAIHDVARPFITPELIDKGFREVKKKEAIIYAVPVTETLKLVKNKKIKKTIPREGVFISQTPQFFKTEILKKAYKEAVKRKFYGTDDASLMELIKKSVWIMRGERRNIKITFPEDKVFLKLLEE